MTVKARYDIVAQDKTKRATRSARQNFGRVKDSVFSLKSAVGKLAAAFGAAKLVQGIQRTFENLERVNRSAKALGAKRGTIQELIYTFRQFHLEQKDVNDALGTLADRAQDAVSGMKSFQQDFALVGISVDELRGKSPGQLFDLFAAKISKIKDPTDRTAAAVRIFGDDLGRQLLPLLIQGREGLRKYADQAERVGAVQSDQVVKSGDKAAKTFRKLQEVINAQFAKEVGNNAEQLADLAAAVTKLGVKVAKYGGKIVDFWGNVEKKLSGAGPSTKHESLVKLRKQFDALTQEQEAAFAKIEELRRRNKASDEKAVHQILGRQIEQLTQEVNKRYNRLVALRRQMILIKNEGKKNPAQTETAQKAAPTEPNFAEIRSRAQAAGQSGRSGASDSGPHGGLKPEDNPIVKRQMAVNSYLERQQSRHADRMRGITQAQKHAEQTIEARSAKAREQINQSSLARVQSVTQGKSKELFKTLKAIRISQATADSYRAFTNALAQAPWPYNYIAAAQALATGLAQVSAISSLSFGGGGSKKGSGGSAGGGGGAPPTAPRGPGGPQRKSLQQAVTIQLVGSEQSSFSKKQIRDLAEHLREAAGDNASTSSITVTG